MNNHVPLRTVKLVEMGDGIDITMLPLSSTTLKLLGLKEGDELTFEPQTDRDGKLSYINLVPRTSPKEGISRFASGLQLEDDDNG